MGHLGTRPIYPWKRCIAMRAPRASTTAPTRCTASPSPARSCAATSRRRCRPSTSRPAASKLAPASPTCSPPSARMTDRVLAAFACAFLLGACGGGSDPQPAAQTSLPAVEQTATPEATAATKVNRFDADRAWKTLEYQVDLGPRPAGSAKSKELAAYIKAHLPNSHIEPVAGGLRNVVG